MNQFSTYKHYPFGMLMPGRHEQENTYEYGFNGMRKDDEIKGISGSTYDFGARIYDPRIGRWFSCDAYEASYAETSPYTNSLNSPICLSDLEGNWVIPKFKSRINYDAKISQMSKFGLLQKNLAILQKTNNMPMTNKKINSKSAYGTTFMVTVRNFTENDKAQSQYMANGFFRQTSGLERVEHKNKHLHNVVKAEIVLKENSELATTMEEFLHAGQFLFYAENGLTHNELSNELEAKYIKASAYILDNSKSTNYQGEALYENMKSAGFQEYEIKGLFETVDGKKQLNKAVEKEMLGGKLTDSELEDWDNTVTRMGNDINEVYLNKNGYQRGQKQDHSFKYYKELKKK